MKWKMHENIIFLRGVMAVDSKENVSRRNLEQSGEVLREHEDPHGNDSVSQNKWEEAMKDVPSFEEHMEQMEEEEMSM